MADLPSARVQLSRPFTKTGVDYAGPFWIQPMRRRGQKPIQMYICLFICLATKAVHIEVANDLSSDSFLAALRRMTSRRGYPEQIFSDCGTNFIGANRELKNWYNMLKASTNGIAAYLLKYQVSWNFNPPKAPHFGGLWEAAVKSFKTHFRRVVGKTLLTVDECQTIVVEIEGILNSRPLCRGDDNTDILTPAHFLIGSTLTSLPHQSQDIESNISHLQRWKLQSQLVLHFWFKWHRDYLLTLQRRYKWRFKSTNIKIGDIVLIKEDNKVSCYWPMGRIIEVHAGADGNVRTATIKTAYGEKFRPIHKLVQLPVCESIDSRGAGC